MKRKSLDREKEGGAYDEVQEWYIDLPMQYKDTQMHEAAQKGAIEQLKEVKRLVDYARGKSI